MTSGLLAAFSGARYVVPEISLAAGALGVVAWDAWAPGARLRRAGTIGIAALSLSVSAIASAKAIASLATSTASTHARGQLACDGLACSFRLFFALLTAFVVVAAIPTSAWRPADEEREREAPGGASFALLVVACLGMNLMAMGRSLLVLYVAIEIVSVASSALVALGSGQRGTREAALRYATSSGVASGVMVYGMSWLYGVAHSLDLGEVAERVTTLTREQAHLPNAVAIGVACVLAGLAYKIAAAPFHMWAPDVYEGAPTLVAAFLSVGPTAAAFAVVLRLFRDVFGASRAVSEAQAPWPILLGGLAVATMTVGNLCALAQKSLRRLLAFSSMAHAGMMLLALSVLGSDGAPAIVFYLVSYCAMNLGAFLVILGVTGEGTIDSLRGLGRRAPWKAAAFTVILLSFAGAPPLAGFVARLQVFTALLSASPAVPLSGNGGDYRSWHFFLALAAGANAVVSFFYYSRVMSALYAADARAPAAPIAPPGEATVSVSRLHGVMTAMTLLPIVVLGVWWGPFYAFITRTVTLGR